MLSQPETFRQIDVQSWQEVSTNLWGFIVLFCFDWDWLSVTYFDSNYKQTNLPKEEKGKRRTPEEEDKKTQPVLHLQGLTKKSYTLVHTENQGSKARVDVQVTCFRFLSWSWSVCRTVSMGQPVGTSPVLWLAWITLWPCGFGADCGTPLWLRYQNTSDKNNLDLQEQNINHSEGNPTGWQRFSVDLTCLCHSEQGRSG